MGLDNGFYIRSNRRQLTREMLPAAIQYPFDSDMDEYGLEVIYHRKDWGWRNSIMSAFGWRTIVTQEDWEAVDEDSLYVIDTPEQVMKLIEVTASWLDEEKWENEGDSIWEFEVARKHLIADIINLALIYGFMQTNPDVYLQFYDSF